MPQLVLPTPHVHKSFLAAMAEFQAEGRGGANDDTMLGTAIRECAAGWGTPAGFEAFVRWLRDQALENAPRPEGHVPSTTLWWVDGAEYFGRLAIRHRLTARLLEKGGHIGYDVRPSARRKGHATAMLRAALPLAYDLGIEKALVTCNVDNVASARVIEANGGVREDRRGNKFRYWIATRRA